MRKIDEIIIHCSATIEGKEYDVEDIRKMHKERGFSDVGYHYIILLDGKQQNGRSIVKAGAHVKGHNSNSIGICYIGGLDENKKPKDTRTDKQKTSLKLLVESLKMTFPDAEVKGHRDLSPDKDGDGVIEKHEWMKACPCFDAIVEYEGL